MQSVYNVGEHESEILRKHESILIQQQREMLQERYKSRKVADRGDDEAAVVSSSSLINPK